ncbi:hypothetical protein O181_094734 [Austropuccinia psidii MF-1]|uniref:Uncharacterized protein n=1 Tax=Austropuccinia psidii MF-1 TaxID=1389203 RepID=A0A9Q3PB32_9BASI|nr:hypothetical protein [Austropuccinia psidii MF-1]
MSFPFHPLPSSLKFKKSSSPPSQSSNYSDDVMVRTKPVSIHHQNDLNDDPTIVPPIDVMVRTKQKIEYHEDNNNQTIIKENSPNAKDNIFMIQNKSCLFLDIQTQHIRNFPPFQLTRKQPMPHG